MAADRPAAIEVQWTVGASLIEAAGGRQSLEWPVAIWPRVRPALLAQGWQLQGTTVQGPDSLILPSFYKDGVLLLAGVDTWSGGYLLATCAEGDRLLSQWWQAGLNAVPHG